MLFIFISHYLVGIADMSTVQVDPAQKLHGNMLLKRALLQRIAVNAARGCQRNADLPDSPPSQVGLL